MASSRASARPGGKNLGRKLTRRQAEFLDNYIQNGGNAARAARDAGYASKDAGRKLLRNPMIQAELGRGPVSVPSKVDEVAPLHTLRTKEARIRWLLDVVSGDQTITKARMNGSKYEQAASFKERLKALEIISRMEGEFVTSHQHQFPEGFEVPRTRAELLARIEAAKMRVIDVVPSARDPRALPSASAPATAELAPPAAVPVVEHAPQEPDDDLDFE